MSRLSSLTLVVAWLGAGCSSTDPGETGAGGHAGTPAGASGSVAGSGGTGGAGGGSYCSLPPSDSLFRCATTYDVQAAMATCTTAVGIGAASAGQCGTGWAWRCGTQISYDCFYDGDKNLVRARRCEDSPTHLCTGCNCAMPNCVDSFDLSTGGAPTCGALPPVTGAGGGAAGAGGGAAGAGGRAGAAGGAAGASGGAGGTAGAMCGSTGGVGLGGTCLPPTDQRFHCAPYEDQAKVTSCSGLGNLLVDAGRCGSGWAWSCRTSITSYSCIYDANKNLVKATDCSSEFRCDVSSDVSTGGGRACDINDLNRPATGCAEPAADAGGGDCCGDGKLPPSGPPFSCAATYAAQLAMQCTRSGDCGGRSVVAKVGVGYEIRCGYDAQGVLRVAERCDNDERYCGNRCLRSTNLSAPDAGNDGLCPSYNLPNACTADGGVRD